MVLNQDIISRMMNTDECDKKPIAGEKREYPITIDDDDDKEDGFPRFLSPDTAYRRIVYRLGWTDECVRKKVHIVGAHHTTNSLDELIEELCSKQNSVYNDKVDDYKNDCSDDDVIVSELDDNHNDDDNNNNNDDDDDDDTVTASDLSDHHDDNGDDDANDGDDDNKTDHCDDINKTKNDN